MSLVTPHQTDLTTFCKFKREHKLRRALHLLLNRNFQGYGRFLTDPEGRYYFRTIKPVAYPGRTPHIHFAVNRDKERLLTTQLFVKDDPGNARDGIYKSLGDQQAAVTANFETIKDSKIGELAAAFEIIVGQTPEEPDQRRPGRGAPPRPR